ncbi:hypothetical protein [Ructibacterium gallinarum]|nr:hypothetical protein [Ructibacterium gallinarum]
MILDEIPLFYRTSKYGTDVDFVPKKEGDIPKMFIRIGLTA